MRHESDLFGVRRGGGFEFTEGRDEGFGEFSRGVVFGPFAERLVFVEMCLEFLRVFGVMFDWRCPHQIALAFYYRTEGTA
jgi:hypothetical protein